MTDDIKLLQIALVLSIDDRYSLNMIKKLNLNPKKACGPDKMPILVLQETVNEIAPVLQSLFQQSPNESKIPSDWKKANIVPIFKKGDRTKPSNYRPVSLTAVVSKMLEQYRSCPNHGPFRQSKYLTCKPTLVQSPPIL